MKNIKTFKKTTSQVISFVLAIMVFVSSLPYFPLTADALTPTKPSNTTQTGFANLNAFQTAKWNDILNNTLYKQNANGTINLVTSFPNINDVKNNSIKVKDNSPYFSWHTFTDAERTNGITSWNGQAATGEEMSAKTSSETITYAADSVANGSSSDPSNTINANAVIVNYTVYNVSTASELRYAMEQAQNEATKDNNIKINFCNDIDLNGQESFWDPIDLTSGSGWVYIEGNGYTIYNMKAPDSENCGFIGKVSGKKLVMKNLNFSNCLVFSSGARNAVVIGHINQRHVYLENINIYNSFVYANGNNASTLLGRLDSTSGLFVRNCSSQNCYIYGKDHTAGLTGTLWMQSGRSSVKYDTAFPSSPETWINVQNTIKSNKIFPIMFENCYSVDCTVFSLGDGDSGGLISCGHMMICRNSFTNNTMYGTKRTGDFIGRIVTHGNGTNGIYDDNNKQTIGTYFENCYSSGVVEGTTQIGGFTGLDDGKPDKNNNGVTVYKNCYSTAMVGMDYAGDKLGGFVGHEDSYTDPIASVIIGKNADGTYKYSTRPGSIYINCYAAGEVGNIQTDTSTTSTGNNYQGGFLGYTCGYTSENGVGTVISGTDKNGTYVNCYYDMQTTAMRERAAGKSDQFYTTDFSAVDSALNATSALTETQKDNLIKLRNDYIYHTENNADANYNIDLTPIDNALDLITDEQKTALLDLKTQILSKNSSADVSAINDVLNIVNYNNSEKQNKLTDVKGQFEDIRSKRPDMNIIDTINGFSNCSSTNNDPKVKNSNMAVRCPTYKDDLAKLKTQIISAIDKQLLPSDFDYSAIDDVSGKITQSEVANLKTFQYCLNSNILSDENNKTKINTTIENANDTKTYKGITLEEMCTALDDVINNKNTVNGYISDDQNSKLIALREVLIDTKDDSGTIFFNKKYFNNDTVLTYIAAVTSLVIPAKKTALNSIKSNINSKYPYMDITVIDSILNNTKDTGMITDEQKVELIDLKSFLQKNVYKAAVSAYLGEDEYNNILSIIADLLYSISNEEKQALLTLRGNVSGLGIDTSIIDEVVKADDTNPLTDEEKNALNTMKSESLLYASQIPGVTGVYTQHSEKKGVEGLADSVDMNDDAWQNDENDGMYPALKVFYDETTIKNHFGTMNISGQKVTIKTTIDDEGNPTDKEILLSLYDDITKGRIESQLAKKEKIVKSYAKASVSTILLNHWDITMNMNTGTIGTETKWVPGLPQNQLEKKPYESGSDRWKYDDDNYYWLKKYENLTAGEYEFKIQQGSSWAYSFGNNKFNGTNCTLKVPIDCDVYVNFDYSGNVSESGEDTLFRIWAEYRNKDGSLISSETLGEKVGTIAREYSLAGSFGESGDPTFWNPNIHDYDMDYIGNSKYHLSKEFAAGTYDFKVVKNHSWSVSYGQGGVSQNANNMSFTITQDCLVFFEFDEETKKTTVTASIPEALTTKTDIEKIDFEGYSAIFKVPCFTGQEWDNTNPDKQLLAAQLGQLEYDASSGIYKKTFTVDRYPKNPDDTYDTATDYFEQKTFTYKVIKDAENTGKNHYFTINPIGDVTQIKLTVSYDPNTNETSISTDSKEVEFSTNPEVNFYGIMGTDKLTGFNWDESGTHTAESMIPSADNTIWTQTYNDVPAGEHGFKVVANGTFSSGIDFGASDGGNYTINTTKTADITITFDSTREKISVKAEPDDALVKEQYVVCGNSYLTGVNKVTDSTENIMDYNDDANVYEKIYTGLTSKIDGTDKLKNYVFKVIKFGQNDTNDYIQFNIDNPNEDQSDMTYKLVIQYEASNAVTTYNLYDSNGNEVNSYMKEPEVTSYFVAGDKDLTGYSWLEDTSEAAKNALEMKVKEGTDGKVYTKTFTNVEVSQISRYLSFKIVADGTWDSGIDYGDYKKGGNYVITLTSQTVSSCDVTIDFDTSTKTISVRTSPDCMAKIDEKNNFTWYLCGDERIVSEDAYKAPDTIYDTVRDITVGFDFTYDNDLEWVKDFSETSRNKENGFFEYLGGYADDSTDKGKGFNLKYNVEGKDITGTFAEPVITIKKDESGKYSCTEFMPGKQWVTVKNTVSGTNITGTRNIRVIPTAYLEAGNDATVKVLQAGSDADNTNIKNIVSYSNNAISGISFEGLTEDTLFKKYNFALTAGYAITDINGIGYYGNYSSQKTRDYSTTKRANTLKYDANNVYFVMTSAFAQNASYTDANSKANNLVVDELVDQTLIGSSYSPADALERDKAKTIVKIYKVDTTQTTNPEGTTVITENKKKVFMDSSEGSTSSYHDNYLKWTGQKEFSKDDLGKYIVTYYWSLADGRYLEDSKTVNIISNVSEIKETVDKEYVEKGDSRELQYTITYTNQSKGDFTIYDVLPFTDDIRIDSDNPLSSTLKKQFKLTSYTVNYDSNCISGLTSYYTTDTDVKDKTNLSSDSAAKAVNVSDGKWNNLTVPYTDNIDGVTALAVKGTQTADGVYTVTITYTLQVDASVGDYYVNNAFFTFDDDLAKTLYDSDDVSINGYSNYVTTAVVSTDISGYVWYDININGQFDTNEQPIRNVKVSLFDDNDTLIDSRVTDDEGHYQFDVNAYDKNYRIVFSENNGEKVYIGEQEYDFNNLIISRTRAKRKVTDIKDSVNIAKEDDTSTDDSKKYYIDETVPASEEIYKNDHKYIGDFKVVNYNLPINYQNLGLREQVQEKDCSLTINKVEGGGTNDPLEGVCFKLEYMPMTQTTGEEENQDSSEYQSLYVKQITDESGNITEYQFVQDSTTEGAIPADSIPTNANGTIKFTGLPSDALYRLTEVSTVNGYNLLPSALEFALPYYIESGTTSPDGYVTGDQTTKEGSYYYDVTYTITNSKIPNMPLTGVENHFSPIVLAFVLLSIGIVVFIAYKIYKAKKSA